MKCQNCDYENPPDNKFCENCGVPLQATTPPTPGVIEVRGKCPHCGHENPPDNAFCENCGKQIPAIGPTTPPPSVEIKCQNCGTLNPPDVLYCENCGLKLDVIQPTPPLPPPTVGPQAVLLLQDGTELSFNVGEAIGRAQLARNVSSEEASWISRNHFSITLDGSKYYIEDSNSVNGTKLNGINIKGMGRQELKDGDTIAVAEAINLTFKIK